MRSCPVVVPGQPQLRTVAFGPGPDTVLALNGWAARWEAWQPTFEVLSRSTRCVTWDTRGVGSSPAPAELITVDALVDDVFRVLDAHRVARCVLAGESLGGLVALLAAARQPDRFSGLVLVATPPILPAEAAAPLVAALRADRRAMMAGFARACLGEPGTEGLQAWAEGLFLETPADVAIRLLEMWDGVVPDLSGIGMPTVVVHGDRDRVVPVGAGRALASGIPGARWVELPGAGHAPSVTRPDEVAAVIRAVLAGSVSDLGLG